MRKRVLIIAYYFPPAGGGGVQRITKFVKYIHHFGWQPIVLTVRPTVYRNADLTLDSTLLEDVPQGTVVKRTKSVDFYRLAHRVKTTSKKKKLRFRRFKRIKEQIGDLLVNPDPHAFWIPIAVCEGIKLVKKFNIDLIFSTAGPWSDHLVGTLLHMLTRKPFIADYRDGWTVTPYHYYSTTLRKKMHFFLEKKVIQKADKVVVVTEGMKDAYTSVFSKYSHKFVLIRNGYDPDDFRYARVEPQQRLTFTYCGNIYSYRCPTNFLKALSNCFDKNPNVREKIQVNFIGCVDEETETLVEKLGLKDQIDVKGYVDHKKSISFLLSSDVLLLIIDEAGKSILTGKIFEYLAAGKPILAMIPPEGEAAVLLRKEKRDEYVVSVENVDAIQKVIEDIYKKYLKNKLICRHSDTLHHYSRVEETAKLSAVMDNVCKYYF